MPPSEEDTSSDSTAAGILGNEGLLGKWRIPRLDVTPSRKASKLDELVTDVPHNPACADPAQTSRR